MLGLNGDSTGEMNQVNKMKAQPITDQAEQQRKWDAESLFVVFAAGSVDRLGLALSCRQTLISEFQKKAVSEKMTLNENRVFVLENNWGRRRGGGHPLGITPELSVTCSAESQTNATATVYGWWSMGNENRSLICVIVNVK